MTDGETTFEDWLKCPTCGGFVNVHVIDEWVELSCRNCPESHSIEL